MNKEWKDYYIYLNELRESGVTNMFGAVDFVVQKFEITRELAMKVLTNWMKNYAEILAWLAEGGK